MCIICFVCTSVRIIATEWKLNCSNNNNNNNNNNKFSSTANQTLPFQKNYNDAEDCTIRFNKPRLKVPYVSQLELLSTLLVLQIQTATFIEFD